MKPSFTLFRYLNASNKRAGIGEYVGSLVIADAHGVERCYAIDADVKDYTKPDGSKGKYFSGRVCGGQAVLKSMLRGAKVEGDVPPDLVSMMDATPFDDPIPSFSADPPVAKSLEEQSS